MQRRNIVLRSAFVIIGLFTVFGLAGQSVAAQGEEITFRISAYACDSDPGDVSQAAGNIPDTCDPVAGVSYDVAGEDGATIGSCTTDASGMCSLQVPNEENVTVTEDTSTIPAGFVALENPISTTAVTEFAGALFIHVPAATDLPDTGSGVSATTASAALVSMTAAALLCASSAVLVRRQPA